jgi:outer membrane biosynthesis protein TonB
MYRAKRSEERNFPLLIAVAISVALHGLLLLISMFWLPFSLMSEAKPKAADSVLRFAFAPTEEAEDEARPQGDVPFETPEQQQPPQPVADFQPSGLPSLLPPSSPEPPVPETDPAELVVPSEESDQPTDVEEPIEEPVDEPVEEQVEAEQQADTQVPPLPEDPQGIYRREPDDERAVDGSAGTEQLDLGQAMREFSQAVARARAESPPSSAGGGSNRNVFVPDFDAVPTTGFGVGNLVFESRDYDWTDYARSIYWEIWKAWHRRLYQTTYDFERWGHEMGNFDLNHQAGIRFVINADGDVTQISIEFPSGCPPLDASAADALDEVVLPPLPADFPRDQEVVHARFIAIGHIKAMQQTLRWLRYNGYF